MSRDVLPPAPYCTAGEITLQSSIAHSQLATARPQMPNRSSSANAQTSPSVSSPCPTSPSIGSSVAATIDSNSEIRTMRPFVTDESGSPSSVGLRSLYLTEVIIRPSEDFLNDANFEESQMDARLTWTGEIDVFEGKEKLLLRLFPSGEGKTLCEGGEGREAGSKSALTSTRPAVLSDNPYDRDYGRKPTVISKIVLTNPSFSPGRGMVDNDLTFEDIRDGLREHKTLWARFEAFHEVPVVDPGSQAA